MFFSILDSIQSLLDTLYNLPSKRYSAKELFLNYDQASQYSDKRAGLLYSFDQVEKYHYIAIFFNPAIIRTLEASMPFEKIKANNIDAFQVVIEEVSHLNLLLHRINEKKPIKAVEMETQAEIDKFLLLLLLLYFQTGFCHMNLVFSLLFLNSSIKNNDCYKKAEAKARAYCSGKMRKYSTTQNLLGCKIFREELKHNFRFQEY